MMMMMMMMMVMMIYHNIQIPVNRKSDLYCGLFNYKTIDVIIIYIVISQWCISTNYKLFNNQHEIIYI